MTEEAGFGHLPASTFRGAATTARGAKLDEIHGADLDPLPDARRGARAHGDLRGRCEETKSEGGKSTDDIHGKGSALSEGGGVQRQTI